jgi:hypothetical protein
MMIWLPKLIALRKLQALPSSKPPLNSTLEDMGPSPGVKK